MKYFEIKVNLYASIIQKFDWIKLCFSTYPFVLANSLKSVKKWDGYLLYLYNSYDKLRKIKSKSWLYYDEMNLNILESADYPMQ